MTQPDIGQLAEQWAEASRRAVRSMLILNGALDDSIAAHHAWVETHWEWGDDAARMDFRPTGRVMGDAWPDELDPWAPFP